MLKFINLLVAAALVLLAPVAALAETLPSGVPGMIFEHNVGVTMSDGNVLRVNIYRPEREGRYPIIMLMGPYGKDTPYVDGPSFRGSWKVLTAKYPDLCKVSSCKYMRWEAPDPERWVPDGYIIIHADSRGAGQSPGTLQPFSPRETEDYDNLITWAARQPWSNGKVGLLGTSYYAINQWMVAARHPAGLAAILPWEGAFDHYREIAFSGGILNPTWKAWWDRSVAIVQNGYAQSPYIDVATGGPATGAPLSAELLKENRFPPLDAFATHPLDGAYYAERTPDPGRITVPVLDVTSWAGWGLGGFNAVASPQKWLNVHAGDHLTPFYSEESLALQKRFFDHFLKGLDNGWQNEPPVTLAIRAPDGVTARTATSWPLPGTQWSRYALDASNRSMAAGAAPSAPAEAGYTATGDGVTFTTAPFSSTTEFTGPLAARLWVRSSTADMDLFAVVRLIDPEGRDVTFHGGTNPAVPAAAGFLRVSHRAVDPAKSTPYHAFHPHQTSEPMTPGELYQADVEMQSTSVVVPKGYRLALTILGHDWAYGADVKTVASKDYYLPGVDDGLRVLLPPEHPNRDPALYGGSGTIVTGPGHEAYLLLPRIAPH